MDWKFEKLPNGKYRIIKYTEDYIDDVTQLGALLRQIITDEQRLLEKLQKVREQKRAIIQALQEMDADIDALVQKPVQQFPGGRKIDTPQE